MALEQLQTVASCAATLAVGVASSKEVCSEFLARVKTVDLKVGAFLAIDDEDILRQAAESDSRRAAGETLGQLDGVPIAIKDNIAVSGQRCSCASRILEPFKSVYDSTAVGKLRAAGAVLFGRTNMDEFAMGSSTENSAFQRTRNPWDLERVPGGSSGGSAAAVAALEVPAALGSDTGGSIRQPASFCGVVGLKPTYGLVSRYGLVAFASSLDQIGPITRTVDDAKLIFEIISGHDPRDSTSLPQSMQDAARHSPAFHGKGLSGVRVGLPKEYFELGGVDEHVRKSLSNTAELLENLGAEITAVSLPRTPYAVATYYVIATAEASANLARFDGVRYGFRQNSDDLMSTYLKTRDVGFGAEVKRRILLGTFVLSSGYYDAYYLRAQKARTLIRQDFEKAFRRCDVILSPTAPTPAFKIGEVSDPLQMYLEDIFTISANLAGVCAISVPYDVSPSGLPIGVQLMGPALGEPSLLHIARCIEIDRPTYSLVPPI